MSACPWSPWPPWTFRPGPRTPCRPNSPPCRSRTRAAAGWPGEARPVIRLGVNIDHVATVRNARGGAHPDPARAAEQALAAGADGITAHLREDRRHITDADIDILSALCRRANRPLNLEMAVTDEMLAIALRHKPHAACLVPERREEVTTEGGLAVAGFEPRIQPVVKALADAGVRVSL